MTDNSSSGVAAAAEAPDEPHAVAQTSPPNDTFTDATLAPGGGVLVYWPEWNAFVAFFEDEYRALMAEAQDHDKKIEALQKANFAVTQASMALREAQKANVKADIKKAEDALKKAISEMVAASDDVKKKLEPLSKLDAKDGVKMIEMVALRTKKYKNKPTPIYVKSTSLKKVLSDKRIYLVEGEKKKRKEEKIYKDGKLNVKEIKHLIAENVQDKAKFSKEWKWKPEDADEYSGVLTQWARTMNGDMTSFLERTKGNVDKYFDLDSTDPKRRVDLSAEAQLMRYSAGAGLEMNFNPFTGNLHDKRDKTWAQRVKRGLKSGEFGIKASAHAAFSVAEGKVRTEVYLPHFAGYHVTPTIGTHTFEMGYMRLYTDMVLSGGVGASVAIETDIAVSYTGGKQGVRGVPPANRNKAGVKARAGADAELDAFAGARVSIEIQAEIQWLNPEGESEDGKPVAVKPGDAIGEYKTMAKVGYGASASAGIGAKGAFKIGIEKGNFVVKAKLGACFGLGAEGSFSGEVGYDTIYEFFKFTAYQLKRADYHKIGEFIDEETYRYYCEIHYLVVAKGGELRDYVNKIGSEIGEEYDEFKQSLDHAIDQGTKEAEEFMQRVREQLRKKTMGWLSYVPPEAMGQLQYQIAAISSSDNALLASQAPQLMAMTLGAPQTMNQLATIAERMTGVMGAKQNQLAGLAMIDACLAGSAYAGTLAATEQRLASAQPMVSTPFLWNSEPEFVAATMGIEDAMYA